MGTRAQNVFEEVLAEHNELLERGGAVMEHFLGRNQACEVAVGFLRGQHGAPLYHQIANVHPVIGSSTTLQEQRLSMSVERTRRDHDSTAAPASSCPTARKLPGLARASWPAR